MSKNSNLKKIIGETAYKYLTLNFNDEILSEELPEIFGVMSDVRELQTQDLEKVKGILNKRLESERDVVVAPLKTAKEMLSDIGYNLHDNISEETDYKRFTKYYESDELLCKFNSYDATARYSRLFFITSKKIDEIKRLENPSKQDEYSTSCMSIGISKDKKNVLQICSRYNHTVKGCDNVFNSNLCNIVDGLTAAFNKDYSLSLGKGSSIEFEHFYVIDGKYFHYYYEREGVKFGSTAINGVIYDPSKYFIFETYLLDLKNKTMKNMISSSDCFVEIINEKLKNGHTIQIVKGEPPEVEIDHIDKIILYVS